MLSFLSHITSLLLKHFPTYAWFYLCVHGSVYAFLHKFMSASMFLPLCLNVYLPSLNIRPPCKYWRFKRAPGCTLWLFEAFFKGWVILCMHQSFDTSEENKERTLFFSAASSYGKKRILICPGAAQRIQLPA